MKKIIILALIAIVAGGCRGQKTTKSAAEPAAKQEILNDGHNARNSLDYWGTYTGTLPAANAPGLEVTLTLNEDGTYKLHGHYIERPAETDLDYSGTYSWDETGSKITLSGLKDGIGRYKVEENRLRMLDMLYEEITGENAGRYVLQKQAK